MKKKLQIAACLAIIVVFVGWWRGDFIGLIYHSNETVETLDANILDGLVFGAEASGPDMTIDSSAPDVTFDFDTEAGADITGTYVVVDIIPVWLAGAENTDFIEMERIKKDRKMKKHLLQQGEIATKATAVEISMRCPECGKGTMEMAGGSILPIYPAQYPHKCTECGHEQHYSGVQYPYIIHETSN